MQMGLPCGNVDVSRLIQATRRKGQTHGSGYHAHPAAAPAVRVVAAPGGAPARRAQFCCRLAALLPRWRGYSRALPLRLDPAFPAKAVPGAAPSRSEAQAARAQVAWLRRELDAAGRRGQGLLVLGDAHFDTLDG